MSIEIIAIISVCVTMLGVGAVLAGLIITGQNGLRTEMREQRKDIKEQGKEIEGVKIELASLRSTVETYFRVRVDPPQQVAVAEAPEGYGSD